ncbi:conjugal transfer protein TraH [Shewanella sp. YLB-07]|uniref:conjugal transfer protein TraH n=1 Tax=Shewanella sp. YLB-07 TaxID=2601268 RepID=UPI001D132E5F|nr:conjugal transfer protein TraH [Shewanella sp. YLB-07]
MTRLPEMKDVLLSGAIALPLLFTPMAHAAGVSGSLNDFFNHLGYGANVTHPAAFKGQSANYYSGGNLFVRSHIRDAQLVSVQMPSVAAGCGGIDMFMGGFSHINSDALVQQGKAIIANAVPFAVDLALQTWAPQIKQIKDTLTAIADKYLNQSINSCEAAQAGVSALAGFAGAGSQKYICATMGTQNNAFADWVAGQQACGAGGQANNQLANAKNDPALKDMVRHNVNIVWSAILKNSFLANDPTLAEFLMSISGTYIYDASGNARRYGSLLTHNNNLINSLLAGGEAQIYRCSNHAIDQCLAPSQTTTTISANKGLQYRVETLLRELASKMQNDISLTDNDKSLLEYTSLPVMTLLRTELEAGLAPQTHTYAKVISVQFITLYLQNMLSIVKTSITATNNDPKDIDRIERDIIHANRFLDGLTAKAQSEAIAAHQFIMQNQHIRKQITGAMSAKAKSNLTFGEH